jgi:putative redox protein
MATITAKYIGNLRLEASHVKSGSTLMTDAPVDNKGKGEKFSPTDLLATALGCCGLTIAGISANEHGFSIDGTTVEITKIMANDPRRIGEVILDFIFPPNNYSEKEKKFIETAIRTCPVALSLNKDLKQTMIFNFA